MALSAQQSFFPISELSAYNSGKWTICARITNKTSVRTWQKGTSVGKVFSADLLDSAGGEIRASFFNDAVDRFESAVQKGRCYTLSGGSIKIANRQFNNMNHRYELVFDKLAEVREVADDAHIEAVGKVAVSSLRSVQSRQLPCRVDLCGIVTQFGSALSFTSRDGKELVKRDITIADDTATSMVVTIWGDRAKTEDSAFSGHPPVCLKGVVVKEWNGGRSGSLSESGAMFIRPTGNGAAEASKVSQWWAQGGAAQSLTALTVEGGGAGGGAASRAKPMPDLASLRGAAAGVLAQPEVYSVVGRLALVQLQKQGEAQPLTYMACQEQREGTNYLCQRRVDSSGFCVSCNRAGKAAPRLNLRCRFADEADSLWLTTFHEGAQSLLGMSAEEARSLELSEGGRESLEAAIRNRYFWEPLQMTVRAKMETYNNEARTNMGCIDVRPVSRQEHGRKMLGEVRELLAKSE